MNLGFESNRPELLHTLEDVIRIFIPDVKFTGSDTCAKLRITVDSHEKIVVLARVIDKDCLKLEIKEEFHQDEEPNNQVRRLARLAVYQLLLKKTGGKGSPWGILTGTRPTKIVHRWLDKGRTFQEVERGLVKRYALAEEKARLLVQVARVQRPFLLHISSPKPVSIYIGIPFCPTRCAYCSFAGEPIGRAGTLVPAYLSALRDEIASVRQILEEFNLQVQAVYLGGGTPTCLSETDFDKLLTFIRESFPWDEVREFTVEAGRPDTLGKTKFQLMKESGVTRVSINPQSMHQETLDLIGRKHSVEEIIEKYYQAIEMKFDINMDLILGLPGETPGHVESTMEKMAKLKPDNLTVHTLAVKRNSIINRERSAFRLANSKDAEEMLEISRKKAQEMGMYPYYLYRQKNILGQLENTGYCFPGKECHYNINIMEERQTIIGLGVGAGSKFVNSQGELEDAVYNPKDISYYLKQLNLLTKKKIDKLVSIV
ncbi:MAG: coproporphyrinogen dehydrogenase HemZ [Desulfitobacteriaceae bacterium]|nr:coproporphyrinogen dehydrogenase HemZ [Desulfitobacteriaceae bacterium]MDD4751834.1 coproporphyrinogen dehydrogenase HemZ [Desulfitobacteriaceae bacterium]